MRQGLEWDYLRCILSKSILVLMHRGAPLSGNAFSLNRFKWFSLHLLLIRLQAPNIKLPKLVSLEISCHINAWLYLYLFQIKICLCGQFTELFKACLDHKIQSAIASVRNFVVLAKRCCNEGGEWRLLSGARVGASICSSIVQQCSPTPGGRWWEGCGEL